MELYAILRLCLKELCPYSKCWVSMWSNCIHASDSLWTMVCYCSLVFSCFCLFPACVSLNYPHSRNSTLSQKLNNFSPFRESIMSGKFDLWALRWAITSVSPQKLRERGLLKYGKNGFLWKKKHNDNISGRCANFRIILFFPGILRYQVDYSSVFGTILSPQRYQQLNNHFYLLSN